MQIHQRIKIEIFLPKWRKMVWLEKEMLCRVKDIAVYWLYLICCSHLWDVQKHDKGPLCLCIQAGRISVFFLLLWGFIHFLFLGEEVFSSYVQASFIQVVIFYYSKRQLLFVLDYTMTDLIAFAPPVPKPHSDKNCWKMESFFALPRRRF